MVRQTACERNRDLLIRMLSEDHTLTEIAAAVGANRRHVKAYLLEHQIPHKPIRKGPRSPEKNRNWKGGRTIDKDGYVLIKIHGHPSGNYNNYVREHRLVMEAHLGRYLEQTEIVHHIDGNKQNNAIENLELFGSNAEHLAETLVGQIPKWTEDGKRRISEGVRKPRKKQASTQS